MYIIGYMCVIAGLLDTITTTAESKNCPGVCVHQLATLICYQVKEDVPCPSPSMRCCIETPPGNESTTAQPPPTVITKKPTTTAKPTKTKPQVSKSICNSLQLIYVSIYL